jgi:TRAP-type C4-dicarboxylate transport system permease small subunit
VKRRVEEVLGVACMATLVLITLGNVVTRYLTDQSFAWTEEISVFLIVVMTFAGAASIAARDGHIRIEFFYDRGPMARRRRLRVLSAAASTVLFAVLAFLFSVALIDEVSWGETSMGLGVPRWWFTAALPPLCLAIAARAAWAGVRAWGGAELSAGAPSVQADAALEDARAAEATPAHADRAADR